MENRITGKMKDRAYLMKIIATLDALLLYGICKTTCIAECKFDAAQKEYQSVEQSHS